MPAESPPNQNPDLTPDIEAQAWQEYSLRVLQSYDAESQAGKYVANHKTGEVVPFVVALGACQYARDALGDMIEMGEMSGQAPSETVAFLVKKQQDKMTPKQKEEAFLKSGQD